ncbi:MAG: SDR family oxidoreductase [Anaerolineae bacterium]|nr:SDR family oxidoreductase [Anaerolineae bacterium]
MRIAVFGATGGTGKHVVELALMAGHEVTAVARRPSAIPIQHEKLTVLQGDALDLAAVKRGVEGQEAVISALGVHDRAPTVLYSQGVGNIIRAMHAAQVRRLFAISANGLEPGPLWQRIAAKLVLWRVFKESYSDLIRMETMIKASSLDWTIMRPPRMVDGVRTEQYHTALNEHLKNGWQIRRADLADYMVKQLSNPAIFCATVEIAN